MNLNAYLIKSIIAIGLGIGHILLIGNIDMFTPLRSVFGFLIGLLTIGFMLFIFTAGVRLYLLSRPEDAPQKGVQDYMNLILGVVITPIIMYFLLIGIFNYIITIAQHIL